MSLAISRGVSVGTPAYGELVVTNNQTVNITVTAATDQTLFDNADYLEVPAAVYGTPPTGDIHKMGNTSNGLVIKQRGVYQVNLWASVTSSQPNVNIAFKFGRNGAPASGRRPRTKVSASNDRRNVAAIGFFEFQVGDEVNLYIAVDTNDNVLIEDMAFSLLQVR